MRLSPPFTGQLTGKVSRKGKRLLSSSSLSTPLLPWRLGSWPQACSSRNYSLYQAASMQKTYPSPWPLIRVPLPPHDEILTQANTDEPEDIMFPEINQSCMCCMIPLTWVPTVVKSTETEEMEGWLPRAGRVGAAGHGRLLFDGYRDFHFK